MTDAKVIDEENRPEARKDVSYKGLGEVVGVLKGSKVKASQFVTAVDAIVREDKLTMPGETAEWLEELRIALENADVPTIYSLKVSAIIGLAALCLATPITWFVTLTPLPTVYMGLGMALGTFGVARYQPECAAVGGMLAKALAWYLAPTLDSLNQLTRYVVSVGLAAFLEYPFLTFSNAVAMKNKTAMRLRALQDAVDIVATFIMVSLSGLGKVDVFSVTQMLLALLRVMVAVLGPRYCLPSTVRTDDAGNTEQGADSRPGNAKPMSFDERRMFLERIVLYYPKLKGTDLTSETDMWIRERNEEFTRLPKPRCGDKLKPLLSKEALICFGLTFVGLTLGAIGFMLPRDPYILGVSGVLGMGLAWYVGPSLKQRTFVFRWIVSVFLLLSLEYPFLTEANNRAANLQETFELRVVQDMTGMIVSTLLITVLSKVSLNRIDFFQLAIGFIRLLVITRFFWAI
jgi:uncharacterized protein (DUF486 family)